MKKYYFILLCFMSVSDAFSQYNSYLNHAYITNYEKDMHTIGINNHTSIKPFRSSIHDSLYYISLKPIPTQYTLLYQFLNKDLLFVKHKDYEFYVNPLFHFEMGLDDEKRYVNTRGVEFKGRIGQSLTFKSSFYENQMYLPKYIQDYTRTHQFVVPGQAMVGYFETKNQFFDFYFANSYLNYSTNRFFNFEIGHGKHFLGDGYRSLLLSDNSFNYPYFKLTTTVWKLKYVNLFSSLQQIDWSSENSISKEKFSAIHYLSANVGQRLTLNLFESIMLGEDSLGNVFNINYLNPIIFYRPIEYSISYSRLGNAIMGMGFKYKLSNISHLYGQFVLDEFSIAEIRAQKGFWANKYGGQLGFKSFDIFGYQNLSFQTEINFARPFTYSHKTPLKNYSHYAQPLAHPLGASFIENVSIFRYRKNRWTADLKLVHAKHGGQVEGDTTNYGSDIFLSYNEGRMNYGNKIAQGNTTNLQIIDFRIGFIINPITHMKIEVGISNRVSEAINDTQSNQYLFFALKTDLRNIYYDF